MSTLAEVRAMIPSGFPCKPGCNECCGPIPMTAEEWKRLSNSRDGRLALKRHVEVHVVERFVGEVTAFVGEVDPRCAFLGPRGCLVYAERPLICRVYGQRHDLRCGVGVECPPELEVNNETFVHVLGHWGVKDAKRMVV
jgi:hypothetical protein